MPAIWTPESKEYLMNCWGTVSISTLSKKLNKSEDAVSEKAQRLGLGPFLNNGDYITVNQLFNAIGRGDGRSYTLNNWIKKGLPVRMKKVRSNSYKIIYIDDFWKWAKEYRMHINFSKFKEGNLGAEPEWVGNQRRADIEFSRYKVTPWEKKEDILLQNLLNSFRYTYKSLSLKLLRTEGSIKKRIKDLNLTTWPIREPPHGVWTDEQISTVKNMYFKGYRGDVIKKYIDKSAVAINGKIERLIKEGELIKHK